MSEAGEHAKPRLTKVQGFHVRKVGSLDSPVGRQRHLRPQQAAPQQTDLALESKKASLPSSQHFAIRHHTARIIPILPEMSFS